MAACTSLNFRPQSHDEDLSKKIDITKQDIYFSSKDGTRLQG